MSRKQWLLIKLVLLVFILITLFKISAVILSSSTSRGTPFRNLIMKNTPLVEGEVKSFSGVEKIVVDAISLPIHIYESDVEAVTVTDNSQAYGLVNMGQSPFTTIEWQRETVPRSCFFHYLAIYGSPENKKCPY